MSDENEGINADAEQSDEDQGAATLNFSEEEIASMNKMVEESKPATDADDVDEGEPVAEVEPTEEDGEVDDGEPEQEDVAEEDVSESDAEDNYYTADELDKLEWHEIEEDRVRPEWHGMYKSIKKIHYKKSEKEAETSKETQKQLQELQNVILQKEKKEEAWMAERKRQDEEANRLRYLDGLDPEERTAWEQDQKLKASDDRYNRLEREMTDFKTAMFHKELEHSIDLAVTKIGLKDDSLADNLRMDSMADLINEYSRNANAGIQVDVKTLPGKVVKQTYDRYKAIAKTLVDSGDPSFDEYKKEVGKKAVSKVIKGKKTGATVAKSTPAGAIPKKEQSLPDRITDIGKIIENDPDVAEAIKRVEDERRRTQG